MKTSADVRTVAIGLTLLAIALAFAPGSLALEPQLNSSVSPDKKWEYQCRKFGTDQCSPELFDNSTNEMAVDLSDLPTGSWADRAKVVWAPDSQRFAFNHSPPHASHTNYETIAIYQLRGDKWKPLPSPVDEKSPRGQLLQLARKYAPKKNDRFKASPVSDILRVRKWTDANTVILCASADEAAALFTLKFDAKGKWKIVEMHRMSKADMEKEEAND